MSAPSPSVKTLSRIAGDRAKELKHVLTCSTWAQLETLLPQYPSVLLWRESRCNKPDFTEVKMQVADSIIGSCGVEYIPSGETKRSPSIKYCNIGDPYAETLLFVKGSYKVADWGSIVERGRYE